METVNSVGSFLFPSLTQAKTYQRLELGVCKDKPLIISLKSGSSYNFAPALVNKIRSHCLPTGTFTFTFFFVLPTLKYANKIANKPSLRLPLQQPLIRKLVFMRATFISHNLQRYHNIKLRSDLRMGMKCIVFVDLRVLDS